ncbi:Cof-type HAD-IIB family hydrolase [Fervidibacillus albus]|uniref:Cof-type HAD-IIB family hydrolase n=1 Tax=Fervidibacillus albus TaxID=2980026 RepID=A0A9E8LT49_9BACI|nr:Cof-type HAD-IIB family hydrolase [Fervidibacillus albus]WAA09124.1 Cof-type HAD-IIB family hydrolase [Fervidibacillus albus]
MAIKAIVCDMDGTLLNSQHKISPNTLKKLIELQQKGIKLILASGRSYIRLLPDALTLKMNQYDGLMIDVNGTSIYHVQTSERNRINILDKENIQEINCYFSLFNVELQYSQDDAIYTYLPESIYRLKKNIRGEMKLPEDYPWTGGMYSWLCDTRDGYPNQILIRNLKDAPDFCNKVSVVQDPLYIQFVYQSLSNHSLYEKYEFVFSDERKLEITNKGTTKGTALNIIMEKYGIQNDEVIVFGDSENDISMFIEKKYSVAMENSLPKTKQIANYITKSNDQEGIFHFLVRMEVEGVL